MDINQDSFTILMADDDTEDFFLLKEGLIMPSNGKKEPGEILINKRRPASTHNNKP